MAKMTLIPASTARSARASISEVGTLVYLSDS